MFTFKLISRKSSPNQRREMTPGFISLGFCLAANEIFFCRGGRGGGLGKFLLKNGVFVWKTFFF